MKFAFLILLATTMMAATGCGDMTPGGKRIPVDRAPAEEGSQEARPSDEADAPEMPEAESTDG